MRTTTKCLNNKANHAETVRESRSLHFDMHYPPKADVPAPRVPFAALLQQSMSQVRERERERGEIWWLCDCSSRLEREREARDGGGVPAHHA